MKRLLDAWSITQKLGAAFGIVLLTLLAVSLAGLRGASSTETNARRVVEHLQPAVFSVMMLESRVQAAAASMGFYLKGQEEGQKQRFQNDIAALSGALERAREALAALDDAQLTRGFDALADLVGRVAAFEPRLVELVSMPSKNIPAMALAEQRLNPLHMIILQAMDEMLAAERDADQEYLEDLSAVALAPDDELGQPTDRLAPDLVQRLGGRLDVLAAIQDLRYSWGQVVTGMRGFLAFRDNALRDNTQLYLEQNTAALQRLQEAAAQDGLTFEQVDAIDRLVAARSDYLAVLQQVFEVHGGERAYTDVYLVRTEIGPLMQRLSRDAGSLVDELRDRIRVQSEALADGAASTRGMVWVLLVVGMALGVLVAWLVGRAISQKLNAAVEAMREIASGDGDLTRELHFRGSDEVAQLASAFNHFLEKVRSTVCEVHDTTQRVALAAQQMATVSRQAAAGTQRQREETSRAAEATTGVASTAQQVRQLAQTGADAAGAAQDSARRGHAALSTTESEVAQLAADVEQAAAVIGQLGEDSERIGGVLDVIRGIDEQTNLLALNAAIEAARAGEQGRGFAVVADEVRNLASRTQQSTAEIQTMIASLQHATRSAVTAMESGRSQARNTVQHAGATRETLDEILHQVETISGTSGSIAEAARQQCDGVSAINQTMITISDVAEQTSRGAHDLERAVTELTGVAGGLQRLMLTFKTR